MRKRVLAICFMVCLLTGTAWAAVVTYPPAQLDGNGDLILTAPSGNILSIDYITGGGTQDPNYAYGGWSDTEAARDNEVYFLSGSVTYYLFGGSEKGAGLGASGNSVYIDGVDASAQGVFGGFSALGPSVGNSVTLHAGVAGDLVGGASDASDAAGAVSGNSVLIDGTDASTKSAAGGSSIDGPSSNNSVTLRAGSVGVIDGGDSGGVGVVSGNTVLIDGVGASAETVSGGFSHLGSCTGNRVTLRAGTVGSIAGGYSNEAKTVSGNFVDLSGGTVRDSAYGGSAMKTGYVSGNEVIISGGGKVLNDIGGGRSYDGDASNNIVTVSGGEAVRVLGGSVDGDGDAVGNSAIVEIGSRSTMPGFIAGGESDAGDSIGNSVIIKGKHDAVITDALVCGGWSELGSATRNTVTLCGDANFARVAIYGGDRGASGAGDVVSGNTLHLDGYSGAVASIQNFENIAFSLSADIAVGDTVLAVATPMDLTGVSIDIAGLSCDLSDGDTITLIANVTGTLTVNGEPITPDGNVTGGGGKWRFSVSGDALIAAFVAPPAPPPTPPASPRPMTPETANPSSRTSRTTPTFPTRRSSQVMAAVPSAATRGCPACSAWCCCAGRSL